MGGVDGATPYRQTLRLAARNLVANQPEITFKILYTTKFKCTTNSNPRYAAGALVYALVQQKAGTAGFAGLERSATTYESCVGHFAAARQLPATRAKA